MAVSYSSLILLVDDDEMLEEYMQAALAQRGFVAESFTDPVKALEFFRRHHDEVDLVITDIRMPVMDGIELARKARTLKPDIPIIFVSSDPGKLDEARLIGATGACLLKPIGREEITDCVESLIGQPRSA